MNTDETCPTYTVVIPIHHQEGEEVLDGGYPDNTIAVPILARQRLGRLGQLPDQFPILEGEISIGEGAVYTVPVMLMPRAVLEDFLRSFRKSKGDAGGAGENSSTKAEQALETATLFCRIESHTFPVFISVPGKAEFSILPPEEEPSEKTRKAIALSTPLFIEHLTQVSEILGGMKIFLHYVEGMRHEPIKSAADELHIFVRATPSPPHDWSWPEKLFGIPMENEDGHLFTCLDPSPFRGLAVSDGEREIAQIVDDNIYILFSPFHLHMIGGKKNRQVFERTIACAVKGLLHREGTSTVPPHDPLTNDVSQESFKEMLSMGKKILLADLQKIKKEIANLEEELRHNRRRVVNLNEQIRVLSEGGFLGGENVAEKIGGSVERILTIPLLKEAFIVPNFGILVRTRLITIRHEGHTRVIGTFSALFMVSTKIIIWPDETFHPRGVPHPHISESGKHCFGNVEDAISMAVAEYRFADAIEFFFRWISEGYTPENIAYNGHKIEEWPTIEEVNQRGEMIQ